SYHLVCRNRRVETWPSQCEVFREILSVSQRIGTLSPRLCTLLHCTFCAVFLFSMHFTLGVCCHTDDWLTIILFDRYMKMYTSVYLHVCICESVHLTVNMP
ncbi:unnamed protein product, partial [Sphacelaria rigidula]